LHGVSPYFSGISGKLGRVLGGRSRKFFLRAGIIFGSVGLLSLVFQGKFLVCFAKQIL